MSSSEPISPAIMPVGCEVRSRRTMRNRGSAPIAASMSASCVVSRSVPAAISGVYLYFHKYQNNPFRCILQRSFVSDLLFLTKNSETLQDHFPDESATIFLKSVLSGRNHV